MVTFNYKNKSLTSSQSKALVVFGTKPGKMGSYKVKDKRRISLLNADYKVYSGLPTKRLDKLSCKGLSSAQYVSGSDRWIQHCINLARDAVQAGNKKNGENFGHCPLLHFCRGRLWYVQWLLAISSNRNGSKFNGCLPITLTKIEIS